jgi:glycosyltransferase involved in cell wall biosynthesis
VFRVFNGISLRGFPEREQGFNPRRIVSVGRYVEKKGFTHLIEACRLLRTRGIDFECLIVGGGPLEAELQEQIAKAGLEGIVKLLGPRPQEEVRQLLITAGVFVLACVPEAGGGSDNLPTVIMEAMAAGVPVISTKLAGVPEMIEDSVEGLLVEPADPEALSEAIARVLSNEDLNRRMGEQGHETARSKFGIESTVRSLKHILATHADLRVPEAARVVDPLLPNGPGLLRRLLSR